MRLQQEKARRDELSREKDKLQGEVAELGGLVESQERLLELEKVTQATPHPGRPQPWLQPVQLYLLNQLAFQQILSTWQGSNLLPIKQVLIHTSLSSSPAGRCWWFMPCMP